MVAGSWVVVISSVRLWMARRSSRIASSTPPAAFAVRCAASGAPRWTAARSSPAAKSRWMTTSWRSAAIRCRSSSSASCRMLSWRACSERTRAVMSLVVTTKPRPPSPLSRHEGDLDVAVATGDVVEPALEVLLLAGQRALDEGAAVLVELGAEQLADVLAVEHARARRRTSRRAPRSRTGCVRRGPSRRPSRATGRGPRPARRPGHGGGSPVVHAPDPCHLCLSGCGRRRSRGRAASARAGGR